MATPKAVVKQGVVAFKNRKFYVTIGRAQKEMPTGAFVNADDLRKLVGQTVPVTISGKSIAAIGKRPGILCYVPVDPWLFGVVEQSLQQLLLKKYTQAGILTAGE
jgi:hypothetical protein